MPIITIIAGSLLTLLGLGGYVLSESRSATALIPVAFGTLLEVCGALALRPELKKHAMHGASVLALLGVVGTIPGVVSFVKLITGGSIARPLGAQVQAAMFVVCLVLLVLCIRSFRQARIRRVAEARGL
jgi:uncharacterized membrane protein HdeD (DUF308 family)